MEAANVEGPRGVPVQQYICRSTRQTSETDVYWGINHDSTGILLTKESGEDSNEEEKENQGDETQGQQPPQCWYHNAATSVTDAVPRKL